jgi:hypothetical protein
VYLHNVNIDSGVSFEKRCVLLPVGIVSKPRKTIFLRFLNFLGF